MGQVLPDAGFEENEPKEVSLTVQMAFLAVLFNTIHLTLSVSEERLRGTLELLDAWLQKSQMTKKDVQHIAGKLGFMYAWSIFICSFPSQS